jgi:hypothetical protein
MNAYPNAEELLVAVWKCLVVVDMPKEVFDPRWGFATLASEVREPKDC